MVNFQIKEKQLKIWQAEQATLQKKDGEEKQLETKLQKYRRVPTGIQKLKINLIIIDEEERLKSGVFMKRVKEKWDVKHSEHSNQHAKPRDNFKKILKRSRNNA